MVEYSWEETIKAAIRWFGEHTFLPPGGIFLDKKLTDEQFHSVMRHIYLNKHMTREEHNKYLDQWSKAFEAGRQAHLGNLRGTTDKMAVGDKITYPGTTGPNKKPRLGEPETIQEKLDDINNNPKFQAVMDNKGPKTVEKKPGRSRSENFRENLRNRKKPRIDYTDEDRRRDQLKQKQLLDRLNNKIRRENNSKKQKTNPPSEEDGEGLGDVVWGEEFPDDDAGREDPVQGDDVMGEDLPQEAWDNFEEVMRQRDEARKREEQAKRDGDDTRIPRHNGCCDERFDAYGTRYWARIRTRDCDLRLNVPCAYDENGKLIIFVFNKNNG